jgi:hypothetical protein
MAIQESPEPNNTQPGCPDTETCIPCDDPRHDGDCCLTHCKACKDECLPEVA